MVVEPVMTEQEMLQRVYFTAGCLDAPVDDDGARVLELMGELADPVVRHTDDHRGRLKSAADVSRSVTKSRTASASRAPAIFALGFD